MSEKPRELAVRILICFHKMDRETCTVTNLARILSVEKYTISRALAQMEQEGYLSRKNPRSIRLTEFGEQEARQYAERVDVTTNLLTLKGVSDEAAGQDAFSMAVHCSDETFRVIKNAEERERIRMLLRGEKRFTGKQLCRKIRDGSYTFPFIIYRQQIKDRSLISMANSGFEQPCTLTVRNGTGTVSLRAKSVIHPSLSTRKKMSGHLVTMEYYDGYHYLEVERAGHILRFPAEILEFTRVGSEDHCVFHGSAGFRFSASVGIMHMPTSEAVFTLVF